MSSLLNLHWQIKDLMLIRDTGVQLSFQRNAESREDHQVEDQHPQPHKWLTDGFYSRTEMTYFFFFCSTSPDLELKLQFSYSSNVSMNRLKTFPGLLVFPSSIHEKLTLAEIIHSDIISLCPDGKPKIEKRKNKFSCY